MTPLVNIKNGNDKKDEEKICEALDKGIDDMEAGNTISHEDAMTIIRERTLV
ncbi:putative transcriptional regulator [Aequitasia blattaphilus]|uniref:Antitoxin n=1 Tax=Aequitasia blattaphilus TaxID=2949332 RepID=A0ABT1ED79_9FIRM|nr:hypothetical protein [Aequitasia blattaphilus]MCP1103616.1 hypothetical protein [Aequitasia blattaphilus]MCR8616256.1 hypothetical protein [Aequitasia blattaphilus]